jgi:hypothetical protein
MFRNTPEIMYKLIPEWYDKQNKVKTIKTK